MDDRLTRQKWLEAGLQALAAEGPAGLRIMTIALQLKVTKGSFYWHFPHLEAYCGELLGEWEYRLTDQIMAEVDKAAGDVLTRLRQLTILTASSYPRLTLAVRSWALAEPLARAAVERVDQKRLAYLTSLITGLGWTDAEAAVLARWGYGALIGHFQLGGPPLTPTDLELILGTLVPRNIPREGTS